MKAPKKKSSLKKIIKFIGWVFLVQFILINMSAALHAWKLTHFYDDPSLREQRPSSKNIFTKTWKLFAGFRYPKSLNTSAPSFSYQTVVLKTKDDLTIEAWYAAADSAKGTVLIFHGINGNKSMLLAEANQFLNFGYNIMSVDLRGHGNSGGHTSTLGVMETEEVKLAYDYVIAKGEKNIFIYGISMGAVIVIKAVKDYELKPKGIIIESPFASLQHHLKARSRNLGFPEQPFAFLVTGWIGLERGFNGYNHKTTDYAKSITCPVLLQWGEKDSYVKKVETEAIFKNITSADKKLNVYENAGHESLLRNEPAYWKKEVNIFLSNNNK
jgi:uncharacterized protein